MTNSVWKPTVFKALCSRFPTISTNIYVIGFVEGGERYLSCRNQEYTIGKGNVILFNPGDSHACVQTDDGTLDYRGFNITKEVMLDLAEEVTGERELPGFLQTVICDEEITCYLRPLHELVMNGSLEFGKEENLLLMLALLIQRYGQPFEECIPECREEIERACVFMEKHFTERIYLGQICRYAGLSNGNIVFYNWENESGVIL